MTMTILRTADGWWTQVDGHAYRLDTTAATTHDLLVGDPRSLARAEAGVPVADLALLSPVTSPCRLIAQMTNYKSHVVDTGGDPSTIPLTFFRKASGSISGPYDDIVAPPHVRLTDYEAEIGLVVGAEVPVGAAIGAGLSSVLAGLVITNDVSARDVQLPQTQFYEGKSYPTFTPTGPALVLLEPDEWARFGELRLRLSVNGEIRQDTVVAGDMIYPPIEGLQALARFQALAPGDLILTGTPVGTALSAPRKLLGFLASLMPPARRWQVFFERQAQNPKFLHDGDVVEIRIDTADGAIDLGTQRTTFHKSA